MKWATKMRIKKHGNNRKILISFFSPCIQWTAFILMRCCCRSYLWSYIFSCFFFSLLCAGHLVNKQNGRSIFWHACLSSWTHSIWDEMNNDVDDDLFFYIHVWLSFSYSISHLLWVFFPIFFLIDLKVHFPRINILLSRCMRV